QTHSSDAPSSERANSNTSASVMGWDAALLVAGSWDVFTIRTKQSSSLTLIGCSFLRGPHHTAAPTHRVHKLPPVGGVSRPFSQRTHVPILTNWLATHGFAGQSICQVGFAHFVAPAARGIPHR